MLHKNLSTSEYGGKRNLLLFLFLLQDNILNNENLDQHIFHETQTQRKACSGI